MKAALANLFAYLRARYAEPSTHAGVAAFVGALAGGAALVGSPHAAIVLLVTAGLVGLKAAMSADPALAAEVTEAAVVVRVAGPTVATMAEAALPQEAAAIAAAETAIQGVASKI